MCRVSNGNVEISRNYTTEGAADVPASGSITKICCDTTGNTGEFERGSNMRHSSKTGSVYLQYREAEPTGASRTTAVIATVCLIIALFAAGFGVCCQQPTTRMLSEATSLTSVSPYTADSLVDLAVATRDYTVDIHPSTLDAAGSDVSTQAFAQTIMDAARTSSTDSEKSSAWRRVIGAEGAVPAATTGQQAVTEMYGLASISDRYALDRDAIEHLIDCNTLITGVYAPLWAIAIVGAICLVVLGKRHHRRTLATCLIAAPIVLLALLSICCVWALADFEGFFAMFHAILFPQGNWTFSADSLLICMLPTEFWIGMAAVWFVVSFTACIISLVLGFVIRKRMPVRA